MLTSRLDPPTHFPHSLPPCPQEMLPFDVVEDTAEQFRTGFGVLHKWEKRKKEVRSSWRGDEAPRTHTPAHCTTTRMLTVTRTSPHPPSHPPRAQAEESAAKLEKWQKDGTMRTARSSKFQAPGADGSGGGEGASNASPPPAPLPPQPGPHAV